jgi:hypothetical protein
MGTSESLGAHGALTGARTASNRVARRPMPAATRNLCRERLARRCLYGVVTGKDSEIVTEAGVQTGWPQPLTLMPSCWPGCGVMS